MEWPSENLRARETLASWVRGQRFPHAILIEGSGDADRTAFAIDIARAAMCEVKGNDKSCGECRHCRKIEKGVHPDLSFFSGEGRARSFHISTVREIRSKAYIYPNEADVKVFVLQEAQDMSVQAQNALLKILEEPPPSVIFILTCENKSVLLETVISRVTAVSLESKTSITDVNESQTAQHDDASKILAALLSGKELDALAVFSMYERDRAGFLEVLAFMRTEIEASILENSSGISPAKHQSLRLGQIIDIIDETAYSAAGNIGLTLLGTTLCARAREALL